MTSQTAPTARDIMNSHVQTVTPETELADIVAFLLRHGVSNAPGVRKQGDERLLVGFVS